MKHPLDPQYHSELSESRRMVADDVCYTVDEATYWDRVRSTREAALKQRHQAAIAAKAKWDASGNPADEVAYNEAFERWIST